jgi:hypothetical protein
LRGIIENNPEYIKEEDFNIFKKFIDAYEKRIIVGKDNLGDDTAVYLSEEKAKEYIEGILNVLGEMTEKFLSK